MPHSIALIGADGAPNLVQKLHRHGADRLAQVVEDGGCGKFRDAFEIVVLHKVAGVQPTAAQKRVLDARGHQPAETHLQIEIVQPLQQAALRIIGKIAQMVMVDLAHGILRQIHELTDNAVFLCCAVAPLQSGNDVGVVFLAQLPQFRLARALHGSRVRYIKNVLQVRSAAAFPNQGNAGRAGAYPAAHGAVPQLHARAGGGVGTLGVDQKLFIKRVFVEAGCRVKVLLPTTGALRHLAGFLVSQLRNQPQFVRHIVPPITYCKKPRSGAAFTARFAL